MTLNSGASQPSHVVSLAGPAAILAAAAAAWMIGPVAPSHRQAVSFAALVCLGGNLLAWLAGLRRATSAAGRVTASLAGLGLRLFPALAALGWLQTSGADLRAAGADRLLVFFYLAALAVDLGRIMMERRREPRSPGSHGAI